MQQGDAIDPPNRVRRWIAINLTCAVMLNFIPVWQSFTELNCYLTWAAA
jgi:hypothetical protein